MSIRSNALQDYLTKFKTEVLDTESISETIKSMSEGEKTFLKDMFSDHDKDKSGHICREELENLLRDLDIYNSDIALKHGVDTMMMLFDKGGDNKISQEEFIVMMKFSSDIPMSEEELKGSFQVFDTNNDGGVDAKGLSTALGCVGEKLLSKEECEDIVCTADANEDGIVTVSFFFFLSFLRFLCETNYVHIYRFLTSHTFYSMYRCLSLFKCLRD